MVRPSSNKAVSKVALPAAVVVIVIAIAAGISYFAFLAPVGGKDEIVIGAALPLSGFAAKAGLEAKISYELAIEDVNKQGGIYIDQYRKKMPVKLIVLDDQSDVKVVVSNTERLIKTDKVDAMLGTIFSNLVAAGAPVADRNHMPYVYSQSALLKVQEQGYKYAFGVYFTSDQLIKAFLETVGNIPANVRPKSIAFWADNSAVAQEMKGFMEKLTPTMGYQLVLNEGYTIGTKDYQPLILKTKDAKPDALFIASQVFTDSVAIWRQLKQLDLNPKFLLQTIAAGTPEWPETLKDVGNYALSPIIWHASLPGGKELADRYQKAAGIPPTGNVGAHYSQTRALLDAISRAKSLDPEKIVAELEKTNLDTPMGKLKFELPQYRRSATSPYVFQWQDGKQVLVYPKEVATGNLVYPKPAWGQ